MLFKGNGMHPGRLLIEIGAGLGVWIAGFAVLASFGIYALLGALGVS